MITVTEIIGTAGDPQFAERLHELAHDGLVEYLSIDSSDMPRRRFRGRTDKGTDVALALDRSQRLKDGAIIILNDKRAIVVRTSEERWIRLEPRDSDAALALGYFIGNLHWRVRFEAGSILIALEGPEEHYVARLESFLASNRATIVADD